MKSAISRRKEAFIEQEVATALRENRVVQLSKSRPVLRNRVVAWIKEVLGDPAICSERCSRIGFERAGIYAAVYGVVTDNVELELVSPGALPYCCDCGELGSKRGAPDCAHFADQDAAILCDGCFTNHKELCPAGDAADADD